VNERVIQNALFSDMCRGSYQLIIPNYTPLDWWECDLLAITKAGFAVEFEVKISKADFKNDAKKKSERGNYNWAANKYDTPAQIKHEQLLARSEKGPSRFYYVVPDGLLTAEEVPEWAGLKYAKPYTEPFNGSLYIATIKEAPKLHRKEVPQKVLDHARSVFYWRFWNERMRAKSAKLETSK
jgi:hypothetical protein